MKIYHVLFFVTIFSLIHIYRMVAQGNFALYKNMLNLLSDISQNINLALDIKIFYFFIITEINSRRLHPPNKPHPVVVSNLNFIS